MSPIKVDKSSWKFKNPQPEFCVNDGTTEKRIRRLLILGIFSAQHGVDCSLFFFWFFGRNFYERMSKPKSGAFGDTF